MHLTRSAFAIEAAGRGQARWGKWACRNHQQNTHTYKRTHALWLRSGNNRLMNIYFDALKCWNTFRSSHTIIYAIWRGTCKYRRGWYDKQPIEWHSSCELHFLPLYSIYTVFAFAYICFNNFSCLLTLRSMDCLVRWPMSVEFVCWSCLAHCRWLNLSTQSNCMVMMCVRMRVESV